MATIKLDIFRFDGDGKIVERNPPATKRIRLADQR